MESTRAVELGAELRRRRHAAGLSLAHLASAVYCDRGFLSRIERGERRASANLVRRCDAVLEADGELIALLAVAEAVAPLPGTALAAPSTLLRTFREVAAGAAGFGGAGLHGVAAARDLFDLLRARGHASPPGVLLPALAAEYGALRASAERARGERRREALGLAAHYAEYAGWMVQECGDLDGSLALTGVAAELAAAAGVPELAAYTLLRQADVALYRGDGKAVVELTERVERDRSAARIRALAAQRAAQGWALLGQASPCLAALDRAAAAGDETEEGSGILLGSGGGGQLMAVVRGWCYLDLGRSELAVESLVAGLADAPPHARRARALYGVRLALAQASCGDPSGAVRSGNRALDDAQHVNSTSVRHQLSVLAGLARRWPARADVVDFRIRIDRELARGRIRS